MTDYGRPLAFGANVDPSAGALAAARRVARKADEDGLELVGIQDHPYQRRFLDTWSLIADLLARTERVHKPRMLNLTGRVADGLSISLPYAPPEQVPDIQRRVDEGAAEAGRSPSEIT